MLKNGFYNLLGTILRTGILFITIPLLVRNLGIEEYGLWTLISSIIAFVALAEGGLSISTTVFLSKSIAKGNFEEVPQILSITFSAMLFMASIAAFALVFGSEKIVSLFSKLDVTQIQIAITALKIGAIVIWARLIQQVLVGIEQAYEKYKITNLLNTFQLAITNVGMVFIVLWFDAKIVALMQWQALLSLFFAISHICLCIWLLKDVKFKFEFEIKEARKILNYSIGTWLTSIGIALFQQGDKLIVGNILGTEILGVYGAITSVTSKINVLSATVLQPLLPRISNLLKNNRTDLLKQIKVAFQINLYISLAMGIGLIVFSFYILSFLFKGEIRPEYSIAFITATIIYSIYSFNAVGYFLLLGFGKSHTSFLIVMLGGVSSLFLISICSNKWGLVGSSIGNIGYILTLLCNLKAINSLNISLQEFTTWFKPSDILMLPVNLYNDKNNK